MKREELVDKIISFTTKQLEELLDLIFNDLNDLSAEDFTAALILLEDSFEKKIAITLQFCKTKSNMLERALDIHKNIIEKVNALQEYGKQVKDSEISKQLQTFQSKLKANKDELNWEFKWLS